MDTLAEMINLEKSLTQAVRGFEGKTGYCIDKLTIEVDVNNDPHPKDSLYSPDVKSVKAQLVYSLDDQPIRMKTQ